MVICIGILLGTYVFFARSTFEMHTVNSVNQSQPINCRVVTHARGETCIPLNPQRIIALDFNSLATLLSLNVKPIAAWVTNEIESDFPYFADKSQEIEIIRSQTGEPNVEKVLSLNPDLLFVISHSAFEGSYSQLSEVAPMVVLPWEEIFGDWKQHIYEAAKVLEKEDIANQVLDHYHQRVAQLRRRLEARGLESIRSSFIFPLNGTFSINRSQSFAGAILNELGIYNPLFEGEGDLQFGDRDFSISEELLTKIDSDFLFVALLRKDDNSIIETLKTKALWSQVPAVKKNQVYVVDFSVWRGLNILAAHGLLDDIEKLLLHGS
jgi:iron complex transport system substrate-binding protein